MSEQKLRDILVRIVATVDDQWDEEDIDIALLRKLADEGREAVQITGDAVNIDAVRSDASPAVYRALKDLVEYCKGAQSDPEAFQEEARLIVAGETAIRMAEGKPPADAATAWPIEAAPRDGTMVWLLVEFEIDSGRPWLPLTDDAQSWTIGFNNLENTEEDVWQFVGWNWSQDCFVDCRVPDHGKIIGWAPFEGGEVRP